MLQKRCANDNHGRARVTVRFCATCGSVVNSRIPASRCPSDHHARLRRSQSIHCVDCGERLSLPR